VVLPDDEVAPAVALDASAVLGAVVVELEVDDEVAGAVVGGSVVVVAEPEVVDGEVVPEAELGGRMLLVELPGAGRRVVGGAVAGGAVVIGGSGRVDGAVEVGGITPGLAAPATTRTAPA